MASIYRSSFRLGNVSGFLAKISRYRAGLYFRSLLPENISKQDMHSLAMTHSKTLPVMLIGPSVRRLLDSFGLETHLIKPSGEKGQLLKGDVLKYIDENAIKERKFTHVLQEKTPSPQESNLGYIDISLSSIKQATARQSVESKTTIPYTYNTIDCDVNLLSSLCKKFDQDVSFNDFVIKASALALHQVPGVNAIWSNDGPVQLSGVNISITVNSPSGPIAPIIYNADQLDVLSISEKMLDLREKAEKGMVTPDELQNASFTISNLSGVKTFTAVINPPQSAVLAVGDSRTVVSDDYKLSKVTTVTLCCDGRVVDEQLGSEWLTVFKDMIENPLQMGL